jgi:flavodoxin
MNFVYNILDKIGVMMKNKFFTLTIMIASLAFASVQAQNNFDTKDLIKPKMQKADESKSKTNSRNKKTLIVYFSHSGNTREIANQIHQKVGGDIFEIQTVQTYPQNYDAVVKQAKKEQETNYRPQLKTKIKNIESYDTIFIGYPNWWGTMPMALFTFFSEYNFSGKTIIPFCTHEGSGLGNSVSDIKKLCPQSKLLDGLAIRGGSVKKAQNEVSSWLRRIGMTE